MQHMQENLDQYLNGKFTAGERRILFTKLVGQARDELANGSEGLLKMWYICGSRRL